MKIYNIHWLHLESATSMFLQAMLSSLTILALAKLIPLIVLISHVMPKEKHSS